MASGTAVLTSARSAMGEVAGDAAPWSTHGPGRPARFPVAARDPPSR